MKQLYTILFFTFSTIAFSQTTVCEGSPCTANDFTINNIFLGDENRVPLQNGFCNPGDIVEAHLWFYFTANSAAPRYSLYLHFNLFYDGVFIETIDDCYYNLQSIPINIPLDSGVINWECGSEVSIMELYMSWQSNDTAECDCSRSKCISEDILVVQTPLIASFDYDNSCETDFLVNFRSTTSGGVGPFTYFWNFGDGNTSTLENPSHTYANNGPFGVTLTVTDSNGIDFTETQVISFEHDQIPLVITAPNTLNLEGCDVIVLTPYSYSETPVIITEEDLINMGGSIEYYTLAVAISYVDSVSGTCPIEITRTFTAEDSCDSVDTNTHSIFITDSTPPTADQLEDIMVQCYDDSPNPNPALLNAQDNCNIKSITFNDVSNNQTCPETIIRSYLIIDDCDNLTTVNHTIIINDTIPPVLVSPLEPNISVGCGIIPEVPILEFSDNCYANLITNYTEDVITISSDASTIVRTWSVSDGCNEEIFTQEVFTSGTDTDDLKTKSLCIDDPAIDLNTLIANTNILTGNWVSDIPSILDGSIFDPANVEAGSYVFTYSYTNDDSCVFKTTVSVGMNEDCVQCVKASTNDIKISKLVTPNNDGLNDFLEVKYDIKKSNARLCAFSISLDIYNRWGTKVYSNENYDNSWQGIAPLNSLGPSDKLPTGTYYYIIKFNDTAKKTDPIQGYILLGSN